MPRELITVQVGQCGNQIGCKFWEQALREHAVGNSDTFDDAMSSFFKNVDTRSEPPLLVARTPSPIYTMKARAVVVDMEEGVVNAMLKGPLGSLFDHRSLLTDVSGAGNNWAHGHHEYGPRYQEDIAELLRVESEAADSLQGFVLMHSLGGGTGSGLGTFLLGELAAQYPEALRFAVSLFPSASDDVVTSPYNAVLALRCLAEHADAVLPIENQALLDMLDAAERKRTGAEGLGVAIAEKRPFTRMNALAARAVLDMTAGARFPGSLNVDIDDIVMNLVPFPHLHFIVPALAPVAAPPQLRNVRALTATGIDRLFSGVLHRKQQLLSWEPAGATYLACGLFARGCISMSDVARNILSMRSVMKMPTWNEEGFKVGLCNRAPVGRQQSLLCLANNCAIADTFDAMRVRFDKLFSKRVYVHHYTRYMELEDMYQACEGITSLMQAYRAANETAMAPCSPNRMQPLGHLPSRG